MPRNPIPARDRLISTVSDMLDGEHPQDILVEDVLRESGVARGSLYHHFDDFPALIETTLLKRFVQGVDFDTAMMEQMVDTSDSAEEFWSRLYAFNAETQDPERAHRRAERARIIGLAESSERFRKGLSAEQERLTNALTKAVVKAQAKGWIRSDVSARAVAVFVQAYTLGRAVDDVSVTRVEPNEWNQLILMVTQPLQG